MHFKTTHPSPAGQITLASDGENLVGLWFLGQRHFGGAITRPMTENANLPVFDDAKMWLDNYFRGENPDASALPLAPLGGPFRQAVWHILREIPYGEVRTYGDVAKKVAAKLGRERMSAQAVGGAIAHNPISIIIPCHRVVGANGALTGYAGGLEIKSKLLSLESQ